MVNFVCRERWLVANHPSTLKNFDHERKNGTDQHDKDQQQTEKGLTIGHLELGMYDHCTDQAAFVL
jgi:hypothetical protein